MKTLLGILLVAAWSTFATGTPASADDDIPRISQEDLKGRLENADVVVLDVRAGASWQGSDRKIKGAVREDPGEVQKWIGKYPKEKTLVIYCS
jgi:rhodanese-related sulfurtransferase